MRKRPAYRGGRTIRLAGKSRDRGPHVPGGTLLSEIISSSFRQILFFPVWDRLSKKNKAIIQPEFPRVKNALKSIPRLLECGASAPRIVRKLRALPLPAFARGAPWASEDRGQGTKTKAPKPPSFPKTRRSAGPAPFGVRRLGAAPLSSGTGSWTRIQELGQDRLCLFGVRHLGAAPAPPGETPSWLARS